MEKIKAAGFIVLLFLTIYTPAKVSASACLPSSGENIPGGTYSCTGFIVPAGAVVTFSGTVIINATNINIAGTLSGVGRGYIGGAGGAGGAYNGYQTTADDGTVSSYCPGGNDGTAGTNGGGPNGGSGGASSGTSNNAMGGNGNGGGHVFVRDDSPVTGSGGGGGGGGNNGYYPWCFTGPAGGSGGSGGGAVHLSAASNINISGKIFADGGNGTAGDTVSNNSNSSASGSGGGGAGGTIIIYGNGSINLTGGLFSALGGSGATTIWEREIGEWCRTEDDGAYRCYPIQGSGNGGSGGTGLDGGIKIFYGSLTGGGSATFKGNLYTRDISPVVFKGYDVSGCEVKDTVSKICRVQPGMSTTHNVRFSDNVGVAAQHIKFDPPGIPDSSNPEVEARVITATGSMTKICGPRDGDFTDSSTYAACAPVSSSLSITGVSCAVDNCSGTNSEENWSVLAKNTPATYKVFLYANDAAGNGTGAGWFDTGWSLNVFTPTPTPTPTPIPTATPTPTPTPTPLPAPAGLSGSCVGTEATLSWNPVSGADRYYLAVDDNNLGVAKPCDVNTHNIITSPVIGDYCNYVSDTRQNFRGMFIAGHNYWWSVQALNSAGSNVSSTITAPRLTCPAPTPTPTPTLVPPQVSLGSSCLIGTTISPDEKVTISWAAPSISYVDISPDSSFSFFYNKGVLGNTSTNAPSGFSYWFHPSIPTPTPHSPWLPIDPDIPYYVRLYKNTGQHSPSSSFTIPRCPSPTPTSTPTPTPTPTPKPYLQLRGSDVHINR